MKKQLSSVDPESPQALTFENNIPVPIPDGGGGQGIAISEINVWVGTSTLNSWSITIE